MKEIKEPVAKRTQNQGKKPLRGLLCALLIAPGFAVAGSTVFDCNEVALSALKAEQAPAPSASRLLAMIHAGIWDVYFSSEPDLRSGQPAEFMEIAMLVLTRVVLFHELPAQTQGINERINELLGRLASQPHYSDALEWGASIGNQVLRWRNNEPAYPVIGCLLGEDGHSARHIDSIRLLPNKGPGSSPKVRPFSYGYC